MLRKPFQLKISGRKGLLSKKKNFFSRHKKNKHVIATLRQLDTQLRPLLDNYLRSSAGMAVDFLWAITLIHELRVYVNRLHHCSNLKCVHPEVNWLCLSVSPSVLYHIELLF